MPKGTYSASTEYNYLDIVYYNGSSYVAKQTTQGNVPTNTTYWQIVAMAGQLSGELSADQITAIVAQVLATAGLVVDASYVHTDNNLTNAMVAAIGNIVTPGTGVLTVKRNNTTIGTFSADAAGNVAINIVVPENVTDLSGGSSLFGPMTKVEIASVTDGALSDLKAAHVYSYKEALTSLSIVSLGYTPTDITQKADVQHSYIYFTAAADFPITIPAECYINTTAVRSGYAYKLEVEGNYFTLTEYQV